MDQKLSRDLEGARGFAAFLVFLAHINQWLIQPLTGLETTHRYVLSTCSHLSVLVFFTLSGYVIGQSLLANIRRNGLLNDGEFIRNRIIRIVPPFLFAFLLSVLVSVVIQAFGLYGSRGFQLPGDLYSPRGTIALDWKSTLATLFLSNGVIPNSQTIPTNGPLWSLAIEVWLYGIALLGVIFHQRRFGDTAGRLAFLALIGFGVLMLNNLGVFLQCALYWGIGFFLKVFCENPARFARFKQLLIGSVVLGAVLAICIPKRVFPLWQGGAAIPVKVAVLVVLVFAFEKARKTRFGDMLLAPWVKLGKCSYTLYIIHFPLLILLCSAFYANFRKWSVPGKTAFLCAVISGIILLSHYLALVLEDRKRWSAYLAKLLARFSSKGSRPAQSPALSLASLE